MVGALFTTRHGRLGGAGTALTGSRRALSPSASAAALVVAGIVLVAIAWGVIWGLLTPGIDGRVIESGRAVAIGDAGTEFSALAIFFCVALAAGVMLAVVLWVSPSLRGPLGVVVLTLSTITAGIGAVWVGDAIARLRFSGRDGVAIGQEFTQAPSLRIVGAQLDISGGVGFSWALLVIAPLTALVTIILLVALERGEPRESTTDEDAPVEASVSHRE